MKVKLSLFLLFWLSYAIGQIPPPPPPPVSAAEEEALFEERKAVGNCFKQYQDALLAKDGETAAIALSKRTFDYYEQLLDYALYAGKTQLLELNMIDVLAVLSSRLKIEKDQLKYMTARSYIETAVNLGMIGDSAQLTALEIATPMVARESAKAELFIKKGYTGFYMRFYKEQEKWKLDIVPMMHMALSALDKLQAESGLNREEYIFMLLGYANKGKVDVGIWNPLFKKKKED